MSWKMKLAAVPLVALVALAAARPAAAQQPYVGEIMAVPYNFDPAGWMECAGQLVPISEYETLFSLIGTTYGGDGQSTFALPDLRGRHATEAGQGPGLSNYLVGENFGLEYVTLTVNQIPPHSHALYADGQLATSDAPSGDVPARDASGVPVYGAPTGTPMSARMIGPVGGSQPHDNLSPYLTMRYIISLFGIYPSPNKPGEVGAQSAQAPNVTDAAK